MFGFGVVEVVVVESGVDWEVEVVLAPVVELADVEYDVVEVVGVELGAE